MKFITLLGLYTALVVGHILPRPHGHLATRAGQQLTNPDNEPDFTNAVSGSKTSKSRVLSGIGPAEADDRLFDWDESCSDGKHRTKIVAAFGHVLQLTARASIHLDTLQNKLPHPIGSSLNKDNQEFIFDNDPAYAQMFLGLDIRIQYIKETFDLITTNAKNKPDARGGKKAGALRFICNADSHVLKGDKSPYCGTGNEAAEAITLIPYVLNDPLEIEPKYSFEKSSSITFCQPFFDDHFPLLDVVAGSDDHTLDKIGCAERILLHEYLHLQWVRNMHPGEDYIGYYKAANYAKRSGWRDIKVNPDNYAWFALYAYFSNNNKGCGSDVWPPGQAKPNKI